MEDLKLKLLNVINEVNHECDMNFQLGCGGCKYKKDNIGDCETNLLLDSVYNFVNCLLNSETKNNDELLTELEKANKLYESEKCRADLYEKLFKSYVKIRMRKDPENTIEEVTDFFIKFKSDDFGASLLKDVEEKF